MPTAQFATPSLLDDLIPPFTQAQLALAQAHLAWLAHQTVALLPAQIDALSSPTVAEHAFRHTPLPPELENRGELRRNRGFDTAHGV